MGRLLRFWSRPRTIVYLVQNFAVKCSFLLVIPTVKCFGEFCYFLSHIYLFSLQVNSSKSNIKIYLTVSRINIVTLLSVRTALCVCISILDPSILGWQRIIRERRKSWLIGSCGTGKVRSVVFLEIYFIFAI